LKDKYHERDSQVKRLRDENDRIIGMQRETE
jgi:hypothetical protein